MAIYEKFIGRSRDSFVSLKDCQENFKITCEDSFNFAYDVIDVLGTEKPDKLALLYVSNEGDDNRVATTIIGNTISSATDVKNGTLIGRYNLDEENYGDITKEAFATPIGRVSNVIEVYTGAAAGFYILYPIAKTEDHLKANYAEIALTYVQNEMGRQLESVQAALTESLGVTDAFRGINHANITYPTVNK